MNIPPVKQSLVNEFGQQLIDSAFIPEATLNILFAALLATSSGVFIANNLLLLDASVFQRSAMIALPCVALVCVFYMLSRVTGSVIWGLVLMYSLLCLLTLSRQMWLVYVSYAFSAFAILYTIRFLRVERRQWTIILLMAVIATLTILGCRNSYTSFDMLSRLHAGNVHIDTLYHASIAAMIKNYGVVSTGLNGLVATPYHYLSHALVASISIMSGLGVIEVYGVAPWVFFAPLLIFSVVACCTMLDIHRKLSVPVSWNLVCIVIVVMPLLFARWLYGTRFLYPSLT